MRKFTIPTPLKSLSDEQLAEVHSWFKRMTYPEMLAQLRDRFGVHMSRTQLCRYYQRFSDAQLFNAALHTPLTPADLAAIRNADPIPDSINRQALKTHCLRLAGSNSNLNAADLKQLFDVFTYDERFQQKERARALRERQLSTRIRIEDSRERRALFESSRG